MVYRYILAADDSKPRVLWSLYFNVNNTSRCQLSTTVQNIIVIGGPDEHIDYDHAVTEVWRSISCYFIVIQILLTINYVHTVQAV